MIRRDYELIAGVLKLFTQHDLANRNSNDVTRELANRMAWELSQDNPRFDIDKFLKACGIEK